MTQITATFEVLAGTTIAVDRSLVGVRAFCGGPAMTAPVASLGFAGLVWIEDTREGFRDAPRPDSGGAR